MKYVVRLGGTLNFSLIIERKNCQKLRQVTCSKVFNPINFCFNAAQFKWIHTSKCLKNQLIRLR